MKKGVKLGVRYVVSFTKTDAEGAPVSGEPRGGTFTKIVKKASAVFRNVPPGNYSGSYRAQGTSGGKVRFQTPPSPSRPFKLP